MLTLSQGWRLFAKGVHQAQFGSVGAAAEWMYRLNVFARSTGRHPITDQIYALKNEFIRFLYQHRYCTEALIQVQKFQCWGTWQDDCDEYCPKCGGTGIYRTETLYAFRFLIDGKRYGWHQPGKLVKFPVVLTSVSDSPSEFIAPPKTDAILSMEDAWIGCCVIWWTMLMRGHFSKLVIFDKTRNYVERKLPFFGTVGRSVRNLNIPIKVKRLFCRHRFGQDGLSYSCWKCDARNPNFNDLPF